MARDVMGVLPNFIVLPMAVSEEDGIAEFRINANDGSSSLLPMSESGKAEWPDFDYTVTQSVQVPTIRLDTFMALAGISTVEYLKVDAEGADLAVLRSAGDRLADVRRVMVEVDLLENRLYEGAPTRDEMLEFMAERGFSLREAVRQNLDRQENLIFDRT
jgi:FkbM family methyltransferase